MLEEHTATVHRFSRSRAESVSAYRFFHNDRVGVSALAEALRESVASVAEGRRHVLAIQDTTELNYARHSGALKASDNDLGPVGNNRDVGFFLHPTLAVDAEQGFPLGFAHVHLYNRRWDKGDKHSRGYRQLPIEEKESFRWIESGRQAKKTLAGAEQVTILADREADIYEELALIPDEKTDLLIRSSKDRKLAGQEQTLAPYLQSLPTGGTYALAVKGGGGRQKRTAHMEVRFARVEVVKPCSIRKAADLKPCSIRKAADLPASAGIYVVEARERPETVPQGEEAIVWRLLTTRPATCFEEAREVIELYRRRWQIEQLFRLLKSEGLRLEQSQLEEGRALKRLTLLSLHVALTVMQLVAGRTGEVDEPASVLFSPAALACMRHLERRLEGTTTKQQCSHPRGSLGWASWIIARLGSWDGYASSRPPGPRTMKRGLEKFETLLAGWVLAHSDSRRNYA